MDRVASILLLVAACFGSRLAVAASKPAFDVVSVKRVVDPDGRSGAMGGDPGRIQFKGTTLMYLILSSYDLKPYQVQGPGLLSGERYDIDAVMPPETSREQLRLMFQNMLADRFKLKFHRVKKTFQTLDLAKTSKPPTLHTQAHTGDPSIWQMGNGRFVAKSVPMGVFANLLTQLLGQPVFDTTGIQGSFDLNLTWVPEHPEDTQPVNGGSGHPIDETIVPASSVIDAMREQMGLALKARKALIEVLVVDSVARTPTEN